MKKVAHFIDSNVLGGAEVLLIEICKRLKNYDLQPEVFHFGHPWLTKRCDEFGIPSVLVPGYKSYKSIRTIPIFGAIFTRFLKQRNITILHSHLVDPITAASLAAFLSGTSHIGTLHDTHTIEEKRSKIRLLQIAALLGTRLITVSKNVERFLQTTAKFPAGTFQTILNGVDVEKFRRGKRQETRDKLQLSSNDIIFICVGRLVDIKGHNVLIEAFSMIKSSSPVKLLIVGDGPRRQDVENLIAEKGMGTDIKVLGLREDVPELLNLSDCFVLSSHSEGLSCSIIEAMAAGLPVVATDVGGNSELVRDGECGYLVPAKDPAAFANRLQALIDHDSKRRTFGETSLRIAQEKFSLDAMIEGYVRIYREMV